MNENEIPSFDEIEEMHDRECDRADRLNKAEKENRIFPAYYSTKYPVGTYLKFYLKENTLVCNEVTCFTFSKDFAYLQAGGISRYNNIDLIPITEQEYVLRLRAFHAYLTYELASLLGESNDVIPEYTPEEIEFLTSK